MSRFRIIGVTVGLLVALVVGALAGLGPVVRARAERTASRWGMALSIGSVRPMWGGLRLSNVTASSADDRFFEAELDEVRVSVSILGSVEAVAVHGGAVHLRGEPTWVLERFRAHRPGGGGEVPGSGGKAAREAALSGLSITWSNFIPGGEPLVIRGGGFERTATGHMSLAADEILVSSSGRDLRARRVSLEVLQHEGKPRIRQLRAGQVEVELILDEAQNDGAESLPDTIPVADADRIGKRRFAALRERIIGLAGRFGSHFETGGGIATEELYVQVRHGGQAIHIGPAQARVARETSRIVGELVAGGGEGRSPLSLFASVPLGEGEIGLQVRGGPVTLASLGVGEGDFGLIDVSRATLDARANIALSADGKEVSLDADGHLRSLGMMDRRLADEPIRGLELGFGARATIQADGAIVRVDKGELNLGAIRLELQGQLEREAEFVRVETKWAMPSTSCQSMLESLPRALVPRTADMELTGEFGITGQLAFDTRRLDALELDWKVGDACRITSVPYEQSAARFRGPFRRLVYDGEGNRVEVVSGRGTASWAALEHISPFVEAAVLTTEDGRFRRHSGFDKEAIKSSARDNLKAGRFIRGASTISMQLAKNLYLDRGKTLSRKLEEVLLTAYLEQALTKDEILELYFNIVELGPMVYGIGPAAEHYFNTSPGELSLGQALYLVSTLPNPKRQYFGSDGRVSERWSKYLHKLMRIMHARHRITERELIDGLSEIVTYGVAHSPRSEEALEKNGELDEDWSPDDP